MATYQGLLTGSDGKQFQKLFAFYVFDEKDECGDDGCITDAGYLETGAAWWIHVPANGKAFHVQITRQTRDRSSAGFVILKREV